MIDQDDLGGDDAHSGRGDLEPAAPPQLPHAECDQCGLKQAEWELPLAVGATCPRHYLDDDSCDGTIRLIGKCKFCGEDIRKEDDGRWIDRETHQNCDTEPPAPRHAPQGHKPSCELSDWDGRSNDPKPACTCDSARQADYLKPLKVAIERDALVIRIGIGVLAHAVTYSDWANPFKPDEGEYIRDFAIVDAPQFAKDVASAMTDEREDGSSPLSDFIDAASEEAINQGSLGLDENFNHKIKCGEKSPLETW